MIKLGHKPHSAGNLATNCHQRWQAKSTLFPSFGAGLPPLPSLFKKVRKAKEALNYKSLSKVVATVARPLHFHEVSEQFSQCPSGAHLSL